MPQAMRTFIRVALPGVFLLTLGATPPNKPRTRTYYIAADQVEWNYVPGARDEVTGRPYVDSAFFANAKPRAVSTDV